MKILAMKNMALFFVLLTSSLLTVSCRSQPAKKILIEKRNVDLSKFPVYQHLTEEKNGESAWKEEYEYLDKVDISGILYKSDGLKISGLLIQPRKKGNYPCIIYNRGGNRNFGQLIVADAAIRLGKLASEGYVVIASQYRGGGRSEGADEFGGKDVNDVLNLIPLLDEVEGADPSRIGMYGWSRGGLMTYLALSQTDQIDAAVVGGAVADSYASIKDRPEMETHVLAELVPNYEQNKEEELKKRSPMLWVDRFPKNVPILMLHGNADWRVKSDQSLKMALAFEEHRIPYRLIIYEGGDHGIREHRPEVDEEILDWFNKYLKEQQALPNMEYHGK